MAVTRLSGFRIFTMRCQYWYTILCALGLGSAIMFFPRTTERFFGWNRQEDLHHGITGAVYFAFGLLSILGLKNPKKWAPILMLQFVYKMAWFCFVVGRLIKRGELELGSSWMLILGYASFVLGDLCSVPFVYLLNSKAE